MRSAGALRETDSNSRPTSRDDGAHGGLPAFDAKEMKKYRAIWEAQERGKGSKQSTDYVRWISDCRGILLYATKYYCLGPALEGVCCYRISGWGFLGQVATAL